VRSRQKHDYDNQGRQVVIDPLLGEDLFPVDQRDDHEPRVENVKKEPHGE
jgi:hypothetical protein